MLNASIPFENGRGRTRRRQKKTKLSNPEWTQEWPEHPPQANQLHTDVIHLFCGNAYSERCLKEKLGS